jgi:hypothetical protein
MKKTSRFILSIIYVFLATSLPAQQKSNGLKVKDGIITVPLEKSYWQNDSNRVSYKKTQDVQTMHIHPKAGLTRLKDFEFTTGTIEFDWQPIDTMFSSFYFRFQSNEASECVYLRTPRAGNSLAMDALQYAPFLKGVNLWDMLAHYQAPANFSKRKWNHIKLVISEKQMQIYLNDQTKPVLWVPQLEGDVSRGTLAFDGESIIANLKVKPGSIEGLANTPGIDPTANDPRYIRHWQLIEPIDFPYGREPKSDDFPKSDNKWISINTERRGLVNLTRLYGVNPNRRLIWLKTKITSDNDQQKWMDFGFSDEVWVLINGRYIYVDKNYYAHPIMKAPFGRCSIENSAINLPLQKGDNEILIGVANSFYGWGIIARLRDLNGITSLGENTL